jgi:hypothetical protein
MGSELADDDQSDDAYGGKHDQGGYKIVRPLQLLYRTRFFGHKFELSGLLHSGFLPGDTCVVRTA